MFGWSIVVFLVYLAGALHAAHAVFRVRTSQGAIAWAVSLLTFPWIALPLYWVFGRSRFEGYVQSRRAGNRRIGGEAGKAVAAMARRRTLPAQDPGRLCEAMESLTGLPCTAGNEAQLLIDGGDAFSVMLECVAKARRYVLMEFFVVEEGQLSAAFKEVLSAKAHEGVPVCFLYDEMGSWKLSRRYARELRNAGVQVASFRSARGGINPFQLNFRNHRKITVVDGHTAFVGGLNLADEYMGRGGPLGPWRDTHLRLSGPAVAAVQLAFLEDWHWAVGEAPGLHWAPSVPRVPGHRAQVVPTGPADEFETCRLFVLSAVCAARQRLWIASPYFVPGPAEIAALQLAVLRGVDVRIMLPDRADHLLVYLAGFSYYRDLLRAGVKLLRYERGFMHQKVMLVDEALATVGTANWDNRSFQLNFEITVLVWGEEFARQVHAMLAADFEFCRAARLEDFEERGLLFRFAVLVCRLLAPIL
ncbi:MAG: cardiolipin synthase [Lentisphaeria bacterium]|nr:cardiolipin synthase [Lentisphaeria bacterium]